MFSDITAFHTNAATTCKNSCYHEPLSGYGTLAMPKAYTYFRFSSGNQSKGSSIERQEQAVSQWLEKHKAYDKADLQFIDEGRSGYSGAHLKYDLGKILEHIKSGEIESGSIILVEAVDRIGRLPPMEMIGLITEIVGHGVEIVTVEDDQTYSNDTLNHNHSSLFILVGKIQQAHDYSKRLSERVRAGYKSKRVKAKQGQRVERSTPFWLTSKGEIIERKAEAVKDCIDLYLKGYGPRKILEKLEPKYPSLKTVHPSTLPRWFRNRALIGDWQIFKVEDNPENKKQTPSENIEGAYPSLIDKATFYDIQDQLKHRSRQMAKAASYELSGICFCSVCGAAFHYRRKNHKGYTIIYGNCSNYLKRGPQHCSNNKAWPYEVLLHLHDKTNGLHLEVASEMASDREASKEIIAKERELEEIHRKCTNTRKLMIDFPEDQMFISTYIEFGEQIKELQTEIEALKDQDRRPVLTNLLEQVDEDSTMKNAVLKDLGYKITIQGSVAKSTLGGITLNFNLIRRSQIYGCYIVRQHDSLEDVELELGPVENIDHQERYLAINRDRLLAEASSDQELIRKLRSLRQQEQK